MTARPMRWSIKLFPKILLTMLIVSLIPFGSYWYINYLQIVEEQTNKVTENLKYTSSVLAHSIDSWVDMNLRVLRQNADLPEIISMQPERQLPALTTIARTYEWLIGANAIRADGMSIARSDGQEPRSLADRQWFQQLLNGQTLGREVLITRATGKPGLALAVPIQGPDKSMAGALMINMHLTDISREIANVKMGKTGFAILLDETGKAIAHGRPQVLKETLQDMRTHPALRHAEASRHPVVYQDQGKNMLAYTQKTQQGWTLITQQDYDEAFAPLEKTRRQGVMLLLATVLLFSGLAYVLAQRLTKPIRQLITTAEHLSLGELSTHVAGVTRGDELGTLARAIERLGVSMQIALAALKGKSAA